jgi:putative hemolysin
LEILIIFILILINGVFSLAEAAFMSSRKSHLHAQEKKGNRNARFLLAQLEDPERFLSSIQVCITLIGVVSGAFGGMALADDLAAVLATAGLPGGWARDLALVAVVAGITYFSIVLGELVPKTFAMKSAERIALFLAPLVRIVMFLWLSRMRKIAVDPDVVNEIVAIIKMASSNRELEMEQERIILNVINATKAKIHDVMVDAADIKYVRNDDSLDYTLQVMFQYRHTRYPVVGRGIDDIVGYVNLKDLSYFRISEYQGVDINRVKRPIAKLNHNLNIIDALRFMMHGNSHIAVAVDKKNQTRGLVTLEDIIEYLIGDINDEYDSLPDYLFSIDEGHFIAGGGARLKELKHLPGFAAEDENLTIAAFLAKSKTAPVVGRVCGTAGCHIVITKTRGPKIVEVMIKPDR